MPILSCRQPSRRTIRSTTFDDEDFDDDFDDDFEEELDDDYEIEPDDSEMFPEPKPTTTRTSTSIRLRTSSSFRPFRSTARLAEERHFCPLQNWKRFAHPGPIRDRSGDS